MEDLRRRSGARSDLDGSPRGDKKDDEGSRMTRLKAHQIASGIHSLIK
jgi:hypothetical protein